MARRLASRASSPATSPAFQIKKPLKVPALDPAPSSRLLCQRPGESNSGSRWSQAFDLRDDRFQRFGVRNSCKPQHRAAGTREQQVSLFVGKQCRERHDQKFHLLLAAWRRWGWAMIIGPDSSRHRIGHVCAGRRVPARVPPEALGQARSDVHQQARNHAALRRRVHLPAAHLPSTGHHVAGSSLARSWIPARSRSAFDSVLLLLWDRAFKVAHAKPFDRTGQPSDSGSLKATGAPASGGWQTPQSHLGRLSSRAFGATARAVAHARSGCTHRVQRIGRRWSPWRVS